jgi:hypothetical protein
VRTASHFSPAPGVVAVVAELVRKLNQEANPLEEHTLLVAERDSSDAQARARVAYWERTAASEERVVTTDVLAAAAFDSASPSRVGLVLAREGFDAVSYALLERSPTPAAERGTSRRWRVRWTSARGC